MKQAVWNPQRRRFEIQEAAGSSGTNSNGHTVWYGCTGDELATLTQFAREDGFDSVSYTHLTLPTN